MNLNYLQFVLTSIFDENKSFYFSDFSELIIISENKRNTVISTGKRKFPADFVL